MPLNLLLLVGSILLLSAATSLNPAPPLQLQIMADQTEGNVEQVHALLSGVSYEFAPVIEIARPLRGAGIKRLRLINVDHGYGTKIVNGKLKAPYLDQQLEWCRVIGAVPHIIIGQGIPTWLSTHEKQPQFGPRDWAAYQDYLHLFFQHVILEKGFRDATYEVANEPDIKGAPVPDFPRSPKLGTEGDYQAYLNLYRHIARVAAQLEQTHPGLKISLGGPATTPYSYKHGNFNWNERFLRDVASEGLKLDFFSFHFYGNQGSIGNRRNQTIYPPFEKLMESLHGWIAQYRPGLPIWITEWGPSSHTEMTPQGIINGNHVGAAWSAAFVSAMVQTRLERAFFLATADLHGNWGWPALFHSTTPKPPFHVFNMFQGLRGQLLKLQGGSTTVGAMAAREDQRLAVLLWNYNWQRGEFGGGQEGAGKEVLNLKFTGLPAKKRYHVTQTLISEDYGNPYYLTLPDKKAAPGPLKNDLGKHASKNGVVVLNIALPPSSVALLEFFPLLKP